MKRLFSAIKTDIRVQFRNNLYTIGIIIAAIMAIGMSQLVNPVYLPLLVPVIMLAAIGGSTLMYVAGMMLFEKDEGTIHAIIVSPLNVGEYIWAKVISLTLLATVESIIMIAGSLLLYFFCTNNSLSLYTHAIPCVPFLLLGILAVSIIYTLSGIIFVVRYKKITDFLIPVVLVVTILQLPCLQFLGIYNTKLFLLIPTNAATMIIQGAYASLSFLQWIYALGYTLVSIIVLSFWAQHAFTKYIIEKRGI